ncbi:MAG TPA: tetratricopeptide repeat protein [Candidatus Limnocylindrales bacterium]
MTAIAEAPRTRRPSRPVMILAAAVVIALGSQIVAATIHHRPASQPAPAAAAPARGDAAPAIIAPAPGGPVIAPADGPIGASAGTVSRIDHSIAAWTANLARNPKDFISASSLGLLYEARGRLTGDIADYQRAQQAVEQGLATTPDDLGQQAVRARLLQTLHDFPGALAAARSILAKDSTVLQALATEGDADLELGDVTGATAAFDSLEAQAPGAAVTARLSRLAFIQGDTAGAVRLAQRAYDESQAAGSGGSTLGWYAYLAGTVTLTTGSPQQALTWFQRAVTAWPDGYLALSGLARAQAALGQTDAAIASYQQAIAIAPQPDALTALGDLYAIRGDTKLADQQYATVEAIAHLATLNEQVYNRQLVLFSVNHDRDLAEALVLANQELAVRKDVYGYDADAWALLANGRAGDADAVMRQALAFGTKDALLDYHAGVIAAAVGDAARARSLLDAALAIPGGLDPLSLGRANAALAALP